MLGLLIVLINALVAVWVYYHLYHKRKNLPWGPTPLPIVGNLLTLLRIHPADKVFLRWRDEYGPIYTFWLGSQPTVCVADYAKIIEMFQRDGENYAGRMVDSMRVFVQFLKGGNYGVITADGDEWREQRRFALHVLRDFGLGKNLMQERILTEVASLIEQLEMGIDAGVEEHALIPKIDIAVGSIINVILFGFRFQGERAAGFYELKQIAARILREFTPVKLKIQEVKVKLFTAIPFLHPLYDAMKVKNDELFAFFERNIEEHRRELADHQGADDSPPSDFVDAFLREKERRDALGEAHNLTLHQLKITCWDLWVAGQETTSTTLAWAIVYLIHSPADQDRMWEELDRVCGSGGNRTVMVSDRPHLPFTSAVINEVQRLSNLVPGNLLRRTTHDVVVDGYLLKAGTAIVPQISTVLYDEKIFPEPLKFNPSRFIDESTGLLKKCEELIPFSVGKRQCLGEALARMELFLFTANLFHRFKFLPGKTPPSLERLSGATAQCTPYQCRIERRY